MISTIFLLLFLASLISLIVGLISPQTFKFLPIKKIDRKTIAKIFGGATVVSFVLFGIAAPPVENGMDNAQVVEQTADVEKEDDVVNDISNNNVPSVGDNTAISEVEDNVVVEESEEVPSVEPEAVPVTLSERDRVIEILRQNAINDWGDDYSMVKWELDGQTEAYDWVVGQTEYSSIMDKAKREWGYDYKMVKWEYEKQVEAFELL